MTTINAVGNGLSGQTGTGSFAGSVSPVLTTPRMDTIHSETNNTNVININGVASAANILVLSNAISGSAPIVQAIGTDTNVSLILGTKGTGSVAIFAGENTSGTPFSISSGTTYQHSTSFFFSDTSAARSVTFPDANGTVALLDSHSNLSANSFLSGYTTTATAGSTTTLTVSSTYQQFFTGSTTQTVLLPVTSTLVLGQSYLVVNNSSGVVTVQSSGGNTITAMAANTVATFTVILTSGTTASSWNSDYTAAIAGVTSVSGTTNRITSTGGSTPVIDISASYVGQSSITTLGTISTGVWNGTVITGTYGGTGVNNGASTITLGGSLTTSGAFASTFTMTNTTSVTFPISGTLATTSQIPAGAALTKTDDTNVTITLGGSPTTALVNAASITLGWTGQLGVSRGGTGISSFGTGVATALGVNVNGSGAISLTTSPTFVTPVLGAASATSINFGQNALNFYEEGSWTPVDNSGATLTFTSVAGIYTRIGRIVIATCTLVYPSTASGSSASIGGLPYTISNTYEAGGLITYSTASTLSRCLAVGTTKTFNLYTSSGIGITNAAMTLSTNYFQITYFV